MIQVILTQKLAKLPTLIKKKFKHYLKVNLLGHFFLIVSLICITFIYINQDKKWVLLSGLGGKCLDFMNKDFINGANAIAYECMYRKDTQSFKITSNKILFEDKCLDIDGIEEEGVKLAFRTCKEIKSQHWQYNYSQNTITSLSGKCIDIAGGQEYWQQLQSLILWNCSGAENQKWYLSKNVSKKSIKKQNELQVNQMAKVFASKNVVAERSGKLNFTQGYKNGFLLNDDKSTLVDINEDAYLVPAGEVDNQLFN